MSTLVAVLERLLAATRKAFPQNRTFVHFRRLAYGFIVCWGRRTISRALCACHDQFRDWSASYRLFSRSPWKPADLFQPVLEECLRRSAMTEPVIIAMDDTTLKKSGRRIPGVSYSRDPMSPPFHTNLRRGQRFIQASAILRPEALNGPARAIPVRFQQAPPPAKPGKRATEQQLKAYRLAQKTQSLSCQGAALIHEIRAGIDQAGYARRRLLVCVDGSYCNGNVLRNLPENTDVIARGRGDMSLFLPPAEPADRKRAVVSSTVASCPSLPRSAQETSSPGSRQAYSAPAGFMTSSTKWFQTCFGATVHAQGRYGL